jgi:hypothetical protein
MNCKKLTRIMPELASGELEGKIAEEAREHAKTCQICADELAKYERALSILAQPHEMVDLPAGFCLRHEPEKQTRFIAWGKLGLAAAACALVLAVVWPSIHSKKPSKPVVASTKNTKTDVRPPTDRPDIEIKHSVIAPAPEAPEVEKRVVSGSSEKKINHRRLKHQRQPRPESPDLNKPSIPIEQPNEPQSTEHIAVLPTDQQPEPTENIVVVATVEMTDPATGVTTRYRIECDQTTGLERMVVVKTIEPPKKSESSSKDHTS